MKKLAIIPARGGSKRIPRKNIRPFLGKPIIAYSIEVAIGSKLFDEVMVSTDDPEIAEIAKSYGAKVPFMRSTENADDFASTSDVLTEVLQKYAEVHGELEYACCIYPTAPLMQQKHIKEAFSLLITEGLTSTFPVTSFSYPILRSLKLDGKNHIAMNWPEYQQSRSQDLPQAFHDAGQFYWLHVEKFMKERKLFGSNSGAIRLSEMEVQDIDNLNDWKLAELKYQVLNDA